VAEITTQFKISNPTPKSWSGIFGHTPENKALRELHGWMFGVMSISASTNFDLEQLAGLLQDEIHASYFDGQAERRTLDHFEDSLRALNKRVGLIMDREPKLAEKGIDFEMMVAVVRENVLYIGAVGESKVMIARGDDVAEISGVLIDSAMDGFARTGSLEIEENDRLLLVTSKALKELGQEEIDSAINEFDLESRELKKGSAIMVGYKLDAEWFKQPAVQQPEAEEIEISERIEEEIQDDLQESIPTEYKESVEPEDLVEDLVEVEQDNLDTDADVEEEPGSDIRERMLGLLDRLKLALKSIRDRVMGFFPSIPIIGERFFPSEVDLVEIDEDEGDFDEDEVDGFDRLKNIDLDDLSGKAKAAADIAYKSTAVALGNASERIRDIRHGRPGSRIDYVKGGKRPGFKFDTRWRIITVVFAIASLVLVFGIRQAVLDGEQRAYEEGILEQISALQQDFDRLSVRANTASIGAGNEIEKEQIIKDLDALGAQVNSLMAEEIGVTQLNNIVAGIQEEQDTILKINAFTQPQIITDLAVNFPGVDAVDVEFSEGQIYVADQGRGVIYRMSPTINSEANSFVAGLVEPRKIAKDPDGDLVFVDSGTESVIGTVEIDDGSVRRQPGLTPDRLGTVNGMFIWENNGTLYTLNRERPAIMRQSSVAGNYQIPSDANIWRRDAEFANAKDLAVDGSIYVLIDGIGLKRYWAGEPAELNIEGLVSADVSALQTAEAFELTNNRIYIADKVNQRILVFSLRSGDSVVYDFEEQIVYRGEDQVFTDIKDIVVSTSGQTDRIFVLDGEKVIRIDR
jgi:DNA-binding beta-propeller fold protein YncE